MASFMDHAPGLQKCVQQLRRDGCARGVQPEGECRGIRDLERGGPCDEAENAHGDCVGHQWHLDTANSSNDIPPPPSALCRTVQTTNTSPHAQAVNLWDNLTELLASAQ